MHVVAFHAETAVVKASYWMDYIVDVWCDCDDVSGLQISIRDNVAPELFVFFQFQAFGGEWKFRVPRI